MRICKILNQTQNLNEKNILIGISLGNRYFTLENILCYLEWALAYTCGRILILIPDRLHALNYHYRNGYSTARALNVALRKGTDLNSSIYKIINKFPSKNLKRITVIRWDEALDKKLLEKIKAVNRYYVHNSTFHSIIDSIVNENQPPIDGVTTNQAAQYILNELPILICGLSYNSTNYNLLPYPGMSSLDYLANAIQSGKKFPELTHQLNPNGQMTIMEAYVN